MQDCNTEIINHSVMIVGYSTSTSGTPYYIVRNSYGSDWGEEGYFRIEITSGAGICGIHADAYLPLFD